MSRPNGLAFSPDYSLLYISNSNRSDPLWRVYNVDDDGRLHNGRVFVHANDLSTGGASRHVQSPDGFKVDVHGNIWTSGPGGVLVISPKGELLGVLNTQGKPVSNVAFGGDGHLYITANDTLLRIAVNTKPAPTPLIKL